MSEKRIGLAKTAENGTPEMVVSAARGGIRFDNPSMLRFVDMTVEEAKAFRRGLSRIIRILESEDP